MKKSASTVSIHPSTKISKEDNEFQIKIDNIINLPLLQIANGTIQNHTDFSNFVRKDKGYGEYFTTYKNQSLENIKQLLIIFTKSWNLMIW